MREDDGDVYESNLMVSWAEESNAVQDVQREPAYCKEKQNKGEGLGQLKLLSKVSSRVSVACCHLRQIKEHDISVKM